MQGSVIFSQQTVYQHEKGTLARFLGENSCFEDDDILSDKKVNLKLNVLDTMKATIEPRLWVRKPNLRVIPDVQ